MSVGGIPGKIIVNQFTFINNLGTKDVVVADAWSLVDGMSIYESVFNTEMYGVAKIRDSNNLYSTLPITSDTYIKINLQDPTTGKMVIGYYRVYKVSNIEQESPKLQTYVIHFVSAEVFSARKVRISKHIHGNIPEEIKRIHEQISTKSLEITPDSAKADIIIPFMPAREAITFLAENAKWKATIPDYCYWETFGGYRCKSLAACVLENPMHDFSTNTVFNIGMTDGFTADDFGKIDEVIGEQNFDKIKTLYRGFDGSTIYSYNPLEGSCDITMIGESPLAKIYSYSGPVLDYKSLSKRNQILQNICNTYYYIRVPGLLSRSSGDMANVTIYNGNHMNVKDTTLSGKRLICGIVHVISADEYFQNITLGDYYLAGGSKA